MKSFFLYLEFVLFIAVYGPKKFKIDRLRKSGRIEEAESLSEYCLLKWANFTVRKAGIKLHVDGIENLPDKSCLLVANHQGFLDIPVLLTAVNRSAGFIAKKELLKVKIISGWMKEIHCVFIDRSNIRESVKSINEGVENLKNGYNMCIFPEGTRSKGDKVGEFKKGSMKLALKSNSLVVPVAINGTYKVLEANGWKIKPADVSVKILKPIDTQSISNEEKKDLSNIIRNSIIENM